MKWSKNVSQEIHLHMTTFTLTNFYFHMWCSIPGPTKYTQAQLLHYPKIELKNGIKGEVQLAITHTQSTFNLTLLTCSISFLNNQCFLQ